MSRAPIPTWYFALVVVTRPLPALASADWRERCEFLLVHERKHGERWFLPAGRVEPGESLRAGALRETLEESALPVELRGVLAIQHTPTAECARVRVIFTARPVDETEPLAEPNEHSLEARWVRWEELGQLPLRGAEVKTWCRQAAEGPVYPLALLGEEG